MTEHDFISIPATDRELITFGTPDRKITIDVTFIPASVTYAMMKLLVRDPETNRFPDTAYAKIITLFTNEVDVAWITGNVSFSTLDSIVTMIINRAFEKNPEKNQD